VALSVQPVLMVAVAPASTVSVPVTVSVLVLPLASPTWTEPLSSRLPITPLAPASDTSAPVTLITGTRVVFAVMVPPYMVAVPAMFKALVVPIRNGKLRTPPA